MGVLRAWVWVVLGMLLGILLCLGVRAHAWTLTWDTYVPTVGAPPLQGYRLEKSLDTVAWSTVPVSLNSMATSTTDATAGRGVLTSYRLIATAAGGVESVPSNLATHRILQVRRHGGGGFR